MAKVFNIDWGRFHQHLMPKIKRKNRIVDFMGAVLVPFKRLDDWFRSLRLAQHYKLNHSSQVIYLEKMLNDYFDPISRGITIDEGDFKQRLYVFNKYSKKGIDVFNKWNTETNYALGNGVSYQGSNYKSLQANNIGVFPSSNNEFWEVLGPTAYIRDKDNYQNSYDFLVYVPFAYSEIEGSIREKLDYYKLFNRNYTIEP